VNSAPPAQAGISTAARAALIAALFLSSTHLWSDEFVVDLEADHESRAGHGYWSASYQYITVDGFEATTGKIDIGTVETHSMFFDVDYHLTDRLTVSAGIPYARKRYQGAFPHDPLTLDPPRPYIENVDQGDWNTDFADFHFGMKYLAKNGPLKIEPFIFYGVPSNDYPFFGHAAVGQQLWKIDVGSSFSYFPGLSNAYYRADIAYVFVEETLGTSIDHWKFFGEAGYQFSANWTGRLFFLLKDGKGLNFPDDFPTPRNTEHWYQHDRQVKHNYLNVGIGLDWNHESGYQLSGNFMVQPWQEQVHTMEYAFTIGISKGF